MRISYMIHVPCLIADSSEVLSTWSKSRCLCLQGPFGWFHRHSWKNDLKAKKPSTPSWSVFHFGEGFFVPTAWSALVVAQMGIGLLLQAAGCLDVLRCPCDCLDLKKMRQINSELLGSWWYMDIQTSPFRVIFLYLNIAAECLQTQDMWSQREGRFWPWCSTSLLAQAGCLRWWKTWTQESCHLIMLFNMFDIVQKRDGKKEYWGYEA